MSKQGCKTLRKMFVFMALFPPPLRTSSSSFLPPPPCPNLRPGSSTSSVPSLVSPPREILFPLSFLLPPAARFPECARPFLLFLLFSSPLPSSRSNPTTRLPAPRFPFPHVFLCRLLYPTFSLDPYSKQPLPTIEHRLAGGSSPHFCGATLMLH